MLSAQELQSLGVSKTVAEGFINTMATYYPVLVGGASPDVRDGSQESTAGQGGVAGGPSPGARDGGGESYPNAPASTPITGAGSGDPTAAEGSTPTLDWKAYLADWGFDADIINELDRIFKVYTDPSQASAASLAYIRGTDWYKRTFPGIQEGEKLGLIRDESDYRSYINDLNQNYRRYFGRDVTSAEAAGYLMSGKTVNQVGAHLQGGAFINANRNDIQYALGNFGPGQASENELSDYGDQLAGLGNTLGPDVQARLDKARQRLAKITQGQLATPAMSMLSSGRLAAGGARTPDVAA